MIAITLFLSIRQNLKTKRKPEKNTHTNQNSEHFLMKTDIILASSKLNKYANLNKVEVQKTRLEI